MAKGYFWARDCVLFRLSGRQVLVLGELVLSALVPRMLFRLVGWLVGSFGRLAPTMF